MAKLMALVTLILGGVAGYFIGSADSAAPLPSGLDPRTEVEVVTTGPAPVVIESLPDDSDLVAQLRLELEIADRREKELLARMDELEAQKGTELGATRFELSGSDVVVSVDRAKAMAEDLLDRGDLRGLWLLAAHLLAEGEPGYEMLDELFTWFDGAMRERPEMGRLLRHQELVAGRFFHDVVNHNESLLRYGLHLLSKERDELSKPVARFAKEFEDEVGALLLGMYDGDDPEILGGYVDHYRSLAESGRRLDDELINAIAQIPTEQATDLLFDLLDGKGNAASDDVVGALLWQRNPRALNALREFEKTVTDERLQAQVAAAIRALE
ncbi:MAG: hypothetical protein AAF488_15545 [Planctomycetota bacterium]